MPHINNGNQRLQSVETPCNFNVAKKNSILVIQENDINNTSKIEAQETSIQSNDRSNRKVS